MEINKEKENIENILENFFENEKTEFKETILNKEGIFKKMEKIRVYSICTVYYYKLCNF